jgi:hypothetical protein
MFTYTQVQDQLQKSSWPPKVSQAILPILPRLGRWSLAHLWQQINQTGGEYNAEAVSKVISQEPIWYRAIQGLDTSKLQTEIEAIVNSQDEVRQRALLAVVLDIRSNKPIAAIVQPDLSKLFDRLEVLYLKDLPSSEVSQILQTRIESIIKLADLQLEIKRYCYYHDSTDTNDQEIIAFKNALESNEQNIVASPKKVTDWIQDFLQTAKTIQNRTAFNVAFYITNSPLVKQLSVNDRQIVAEVLSLYNWLLQPYTTPEEIENYEKQRVIVKTNVTPNVSKEDISHLQPRSQPQPKPEPQTNPFGIINRAQSPATPRGIIRDATNIKVEEEGQRLAGERQAAAQYTQQKQDTITQKLAELRNRRNQP